jgi:hypothetical protein
MMVFCDENSSVLEWSSEEVVIPYISPIDGRKHRYFVDFWIKLKLADGKEEVCLIEIKPKKQTQKPETPKSKKVSKSKMFEIRNWMINSAKWEAAKDFCENRGWKFKILTEENLFGKK